MTARKKAKSESMDETIQRYYEYRGMEFPNPLQALLFLISEVGELAEAFLEEIPVTSLSLEEYLSLSGMTDVGKNADRVVSGQARWVRNGDRVKAPNVCHEIADVEMMIRVFAFGFGTGAETCLLEKMKTKGFDRDGE